MKFKYLNKINLGEEEINELGECGWELVSVIHHPYFPAISEQIPGGSRYICGHDQYTEFFFKRSEQTDPEEG